MFRYFWCGRLINVQMAKARKLILQQIFSMLKKFGFQRKSLSNILLIFISIVLFWTFVIFFYVNKVLFFKCSKHLSESDILLPNSQRLEIRQYSTRQFGFVGDGLRKIMEHQDKEYEVLRNRARTIEERLRLLRTFNLTNHTQTQNTKKVETNLSLTSRSIDISDGTIIPNVKKEHTYKSYSVSVQKLLRKHISNKSSTVDQFTLSSEMDVQKGTLRKNKNIIVETIPENPFELTRRAHSRDNFHKSLKQKTGLMDINFSTVSKQEQESIKKDPYDGINTEHSLNTEEFMEFSDEGTIGFNQDVSEKEYLLEALKNVTANLSDSDEQKLKEREGLLEQRRQMFLRHSFNVAASDELPWNRSLPDTRVNSCQQMKYDLSQLPPATIIICFHNEALSALLRTVHSVMQRTPPLLLQDLILIDDHSSLDELGEPLEKKLSHLSKVRLIRNDRREGLIRSRLIGSKAASSDVLVFLDSHCECNSGWLEPLLQSVKTDPHKIICPEIDTIRFDTFEYVRSPKRLHGSFTWKLQFMWKGVPQYIQNNTLSEADTFRSPAMIGGLFAINKNYFFELGGYDEDLDIWGGENLELSFRVWMCGGSIEIHPCSRVGHVFRHIIPYDFPGGGLQTIQKNLARVAEVWMDEYKYFYYASQGISPKDIQVGNIESRRGLREQLQCQSFDWYLNHVIPEIPVPSLDVIYFGEIRSSQALLCLVVENRNRTRTIGLKGCHGYAKNQHFYITKEGYFHHDNLCVVMTDNSTLTLEPCLHEKWSVKDSHIQHTESELCLTAVDNEVVILDTCIDEDKAQHWSPSYHFDWTKLQNII